MNAPQRVVISATGILSPLGNSTTEFETALFSGCSGIKATHGNPLFNNIPIPYAGRLDPGIFSPEISPLLYYVEAARLLTRQVCAALGETRLNFDAIVCGTRSATNFNLAFQLLRDQKIPAGFLDSICPESQPNAAAQELVAHGHNPGPENRRICQVNACVTGSSVIGDAFHRVRVGEWERALIFATELDPNPITIIGLHLLGALTTEDCLATNASRPYSLNRAGFVKSEAAGMLVIEKYESAKQRQANILAEIVGYGSTTDAWHLTASREDLAGAVCAIQIAMKDAEISASEIDYINGHGTSTPLGDPQECQAIKKAFGALAHTIPISSLKSQIGHSTVACGIIEAIATGYMLQTQKIAPTINFLAGDPICNLDFVPNTSRPHSMRYAISTNFGFGGQNTCLVFKAVDL